MAIPDVNDYHFLILQLGYLDALSAIKTEEEILKHCHALHHIVSHLFYYSAHLRLDFVKAILHTIEDKGTLDNKAICIANIIITQQYKNSFYDQLSEYPKLQ